MVHGEAAGGHLEPVHRQGVHHLVGQHHPPESGLGKRVDPAHTPARIGCVRGDGLALPRGHCAAQLQDPVAHASPRSELGHHPGRQGPRAGPDLDDLPLTDQRQGLIDLTGHGAPEQRRGLGRGGEVAAGPEGSPAGAVVPEPGGIEHNLHVSGEWNRPPTGLDLGSYQVMHPLDASPFADVEGGELRQRPHRPSPRTAAIITPMTSERFDAAPRRHSRLGRR